MWNKAIRVALTKPTWDLVCVCMSLLFRFFDFLSFLLCHKLVCTWHNTYLAVLASMEALITRWKLATSLSNDGGVPAVALRFWKIVPVRSKFNWFEICKKHYPPIPRFNWDSLASKEEKARRKINKSYTFQIYWAISLLRMQIFMLNLRIIRSYLVQISY